MTHHVGHSVRILPGREHEGCKGVTDLIHRPPSETGSPKGRVPDAVSQVIHIEGSSFMAAEDVRSLEEYLGLLICWELFTEDVTHSFNPESSDHKGS